MSWLDDPERVREEYSTERGLEARRAAYRFAEGPDAREMTLEAVLEVSPRRVLEVGCGPGELAARIMAELGAEVIALDISPRMVELARRRGVDARLGDVQELPFGDDEFDCGVAAWMLYHARDVDRALAELARVLRPGGRLVAVTNHPGHFAEIRHLIGAPPLRETSFSGSNGEELLRRRFARVDVRDAGGTVRFPDRAAVAAYVEASPSLSETGSEVPEFDGPLVALARPVVFVAEKAA